MAKEYASSTHIHIQIDTWRINWKTTLRIVVQSLSHDWLFATPCTAACQASLSFTVSQTLLKLMSTESVILSNYLILCLPLLHMPSIIPSIRVFSNESAFHIRWERGMVIRYSILAWRIPWTEEPGRLQSLGS